MKKYKVITDNLDFLGIKKGFSFTEGKIIFTMGDNVDRIIYNDVISRCISNHPDWFEQIEVSNSPRYFTMAEMVDFGRFIRNKMAQKAPAVDIHSVDEWFELSAKPKG